MPILRKQKVREYTTVDNYFVNDTPVHHKTICQGTQPSRILCQWDSILKATEKVFYELYPNKVKCNTWHTPCPISKDMLAFIDYKKHDLIYNNCKNAKVRRDDSITVIELAYWLQEAYNKCVFKPIYDKIKHKVVVLKDSTTENELKNRLNYDIVC